MRKYSLHIMITLAILAIVGAYSAHAALATPNEDGTRPGWGHGDDNHDHTGPPGQTVNPDNTRPGNGNGDDNHDHTGPPGQQ